MKYEQIKERLKDRNLRVVAERIGMPHSKLWRLATGRTKEPLKEDLQQIATYLRG
jgi:transcriptional regulator with XRE-family HTH domain